MLDTKVYPIGNKTHINHVKIDFFSIHYHFLSQLWNKGQKCKTNEAD